VVRLALPVILIILLIACSTIVAHAYTELIPNSNFSLGNNDYYDHVVSGTGTSTILNNSSVSMFGASDPWYGFMNLSTAGTCDEYPNGGSNVSVTPGTWYNCTLWVMGWPSGGVTLGAGQLYASGSYNNSAASSMTCICNNVSYTLNTLWVYTQSSTYGVKLTSQLTSIGSVNVGAWSMHLASQDTPLSLFGTNTSQGFAPLTVQTIDYSMNMNSTLNGACTWTYQWGDGTSNTTGQQDPTHTYTSPGTYTINETVTNEAGSSTSSNVVIVAVSNNPTLSLGASSYSVLETAGSITIPISATVSQPADMPITITATDGPANAEGMNGVNYNCPASVTMSQGSTSANLVIGINNTPIYIGNLTFTVSIGSGSGYTVGSPSMATVTIVETHSILTMAPALFAPAQGAYYGQTLNYTEQSDMPSWFENQTGHMAAIIDEFRYFGQTIDTGDGFGYDTSPSGHTETYLSAIAARNETPLVCWQPDGPNGEGHYDTNNIGLIANGSFDSYIWNVALECKAYGAANPGNPAVFIRFAHEANGINNYPWAGQPVVCVKASQRIYDIFAQAGCTNVAFIWDMSYDNTNSYGGSGSGSWVPYYPGNAYVNWVGLDCYIFSDYERNWSRQIGMGDTSIADFYNTYCTGDGKPMAIPEMAVQYPLSTTSLWPYYDSDALNGAGDIVSYYQYLLAHPQIKLFTWFNYSLESLDLGGATATYSWDGMGPWTELQWWQYFVQGPDSNYLLSHVLATGASEPFANFTAAPTSGTVPLSVTFTDTSTGGPTSWQWSFGDGSSNSTAENPSHTYTSPGTYTVTLTASNANGGSSYTATNYIVAGDWPIASFTVSGASGYAPLTVTFTDTSSNTPTSWQWSFGDGSANQTVESPTYIYNNPGTYTVILTASNTFGSSSASTSIYVSAGPGQATPSPTPRALFPVSNTLPNSASTSLWTQFQSDFLNGGNVSTYNLGAVVGDIFAPLTVGDGVEVMGLGLFLWAIIVFLVLSMSAIASRSLLPAIAFLILCYPIFWFMMPFELVGKIVGTLACLFITAMLYLYVRGRRLS
jgi:PKD repeat protein